MKIHPTAIVDPQASLGSGVEIGPYAILEGPLEIGDHCVIGSHAVLQGPLRMGAGNQVFTHAALGLAPQDLKYMGEPTRLEIGASNVFREFCTVHRGTIQGRGVTTIGSRNLFMAYSHIAHDGWIGDECVLSNGVSLAGHVEIQDRAIIGGLTGIHQFVRIGRAAFVGGCSALERDVVPFGLVAGNRASLRQYNAVGLTRQNYAPETIEQIRNLFRWILDPTLNTLQLLEKLEKEPDTPESHELITFIRGSSRGILRGSRRSR